MFDVVMPQMGESITQATILKWFKKPGEKVAQGENLLEISTEKVTAEIPAPVEGTLAELMFPQDTVVDVDTIIARIAPPGVAIEPKSSASSQSSTSSPENRVGAAPSPAATEAPASSNGAYAAQKSGVGPAPSPVAKSAGTSVNDQRADRLRTRSTPLVRAMAKQAGIDLTALSGSGHLGRVTKRDLAAYLESPTPQATSGHVAPSPIVGDSDVVEPLSHMRRLIADHMVASVRTSPHAYTVHEVDMTRVEKLRRQHSERLKESSGVRLTPLAFISLAVCEALRKYPMLNASLRGTDVVKHKQVHLGVAVAIDGGLIVPVIKSADSLNLIGMARALNDLADRARSKRLQPNEASGGTFTLTSPGQLGAVMATPIINQPQSAILHIGAIAKRACVVEFEGQDVIVPRSKVFLTLGIDHRLIDGWLADTFMGAIKDRLESAKFDL